MAEINVTPLVDVMLVLLIIFMVTAPLLVAGVPIKLPQSRAKALDQDSKPVTLSIDGEGQVFLDDNAGDRRATCRSVSRSCASSSIRRRSSSCAPTRASNYGTRHAHHGRTQSRWPEQGRIGHDRSRSTVRPLRQPVPVQTKSPRVARWTAANASASASRRPATCCSSRCWRSACFTGRPPSPVAPPSMEVALTDKIALESRASSHEEVQTAQAEELGASEPDAAPARAGRRRSLPKPKPAPKPDKVPEAKPDKAKPKSRAELAKAMQDLAKADKTKPPRFAARRCAEGP